MKKSFAVVCLALTLASGVQAESADSHPDTRNPVGLQLYSLRAQFAQDVPGSLDKVPLGQGKIDYAPILRAADKAGVQGHFIEDESPDVEKQIPQSLLYLKTVKW